MKESPVLVTASCTLNRLRGSQSTSRSLREKFDTEIAAPRRFRTPICTEVKRDKISSQTVRMEGRLHNSVWLRGDRSSPRLHPNAMIGKTGRAFPLFPLAETLRVADFSRRSRAPPYHAGHPPTKPTASEEKKVDGRAGGRHVARLTLLAFSWKEQRAILRSLRMTDLIDTEEIASRLQPRALP